MTAFVVIDASLVVKLLIEEEHSDKVTTLLHSWNNEGVRPVAPYLMTGEVANALYRRVVGNDVTLGDATRLIERLMSFGIELRHPPNLTIMALQLAHRFRQGAVYDSHYLALAEILDCDLWTADERFFRVVAGSFSKVHRLSEVEVGEL